jgi:regulator of sigma E protease
VNIVLAFLILAVLFMANGTSEPPPRVGAVERGTPAAGALRPGDVIVKVDGAAPAGRDLTTQNQSIVNRIARHKGTPLSFTVRRDGALRTLRITPFFDADARRWRIGFGVGGTDRPAGVVRASGLAVSQMWFITEATVKAIAGVFSAEKRKQIGGVVGSYEATRQATQISFTRTMLLLAFISLSLGVVNLFPFLPLDGGHIFWALAEKIRGRAIPFSVMERAGFVGFALVIGLFLIGLTNDIGRLTDGGFRVR